MMDWYWNAISWIGPWPSGVTTHSIRLAVAFAFPSGAVQSAKSANHSVIFLKPVQADPRDIGFGQALIPLKVTPRMKYRWAEKKMSSSGSTDTMETAITWWMKMKRPPCIMRRPKASVY